MATDRMKILQQLTSGLEECQKSLNGYLDGKRHVFPRCDSKIEFTFTSQIYVWTTHAYTSKEKNKETDKNGREQESAHRNIRSQNEFPSRK